MIHGFIFQLQRGECIVVDLGNRAVALRGVATRSRLRRRRRLPFWVPTLVTLGKTVERWVDRRVFAMY